jgi:hypothetical protein
MILNESAKSPFTEQAENPNFINSIITEKYSFKAKQLIDHELSVSSMEHFKISPMLAISIWILDLIMDEISPSNFSIWFCPERTHMDSECALEQGLWISDGRHLHSDIQLLSKTCIYIPDGIMDACFMIFNFHSIFQLLFRKDCELHICVNK